MHRYLFAFFLLALVLGPAPLGPRAAAAEAKPAPLTAPFVVTDCTDAGLRRALANNGTISFNCPTKPATIDLTGGEIELVRNTIIDGGGSVTIDAGGRSRIFRTRPYQQLLLMNLTLQNGRARRNADVGKAYQTGDNLKGMGSGGALYVEDWADVTIQNVRFLNNVAEANTALADKSDILCTGGGAIFLSGFNYAEIFNSVFRNNTAMNGGAINNLSSDLIIESSHFEGNVSTHVNSSAGNRDLCGGGGAIYIDGASPTGQKGVETIDIRSSVFLNNRTDRKGGAIFMYLYPTGMQFRTGGDKVYMGDLIFDSNVANAPNIDLFEKLTVGGGALDLQAQGTTRGVKVTIERTSITNNRAASMGGGVWNENVPLEMTNVTIANNVAEGVSSVSYHRGSGGGLVLGQGGVFNGAGVRLMNVTITGNRAVYRGGGITGWGQSVPTQAQMGNTIVANNSSSSGTANNCHVTLTNLGGNVQYPAPNSANDDVRCTASVTVGNPDLGALGDHGGRMHTVPIGSNSAAVDRGVAANCTGAAALDQRRYSRYRGCDSGAFEYNGRPLEPQSFLPLIVR